MQRTDCPQQHITPGFRCIWSPDCGVSDTCDNKSGNNSILCIYIAKVLPVEQSLSKRPFSLIKVKLSISFWMLLGLATCKQQRGFSVWEFVGKTIGTGDQERTWMVTRKLEGNWERMSRRFTASWTQQVGWANLLFPVPPDLAWPVDASCHLLVISWNRFSAPSTRRTLGSITALLPTMQAQPGVRSRRWKSVSCFLKRFHLKPG